MKSPRMMTLLGLVVMLFAVASMAASSKNFGTHLSGDLEAPDARDTNAQGQAIFKLSADGQSLEYKLIVANIENVTQAHIHLGKPGETGGIVVWLYPPGPPSQRIPGRTNGVLAQGTITKANLVNALAGEELSVLIEAIQSGEAYVNVHTDDGVDPANTGPGDFPAGEIRGNFHNH